MISRTNGALAVRDSENRHVAGDAADLVNDLAFGCVVERRARLVEEEDFRIRIESSGDGDPLALAAGEFQPALADDGVKAQRHRLDTLENSGPGRRRAQPVAIKWSSEHDVRRQCIVEQHHLLRHDADRRIPVRPVDLPQIHPIGRDAAGHRRERFEREPEDGGLARAGLAGDEGDWSSFRDEADIVDPAPVLIGKADMLELQPTGGRREF